MRSGSRQPPKHVRCRDAPCRLAGGRPAFPEFSGAGLDRQVEVAAAVCIPPPAPASRFTGLTRLASRPEFSARRAGARNDTLRRIFRPLVRWRSGTIAAGVVTLGDVPSQHFGARNCTIPPGHRGNGTCEFRRSCRFAVPPDSRQASGWSAASRLLRRQNLHQENSALPMDPSGVRQSAVPDL